MQNTINNGDDIDEEVTGRAEMLRAKIITFPPHIVSLLTEAEKNQRRGLVEAEKRKILNIDPMTITRHKRADYLAQWRGFRYYVEIEHDEVIDALYKWLSVAVLRLNFLQEYMVTEAEKALLRNTRASVIGELQNELDGPPKPETAGLRAMLDALESGLEAEERALDVETRVAAILSIYCPVAIDSLPLDARNCTICSDPYGETHADKVPCYPRVSPCCPPATVGDNCIVAWLLAGGTCPVHRGPMGARIRAAALELEQRGAMR